MRAGRQRAALAGLEIHHVIADGAALERQRRVACLAEQREIDAEAFIRRLGAGDRLKHQIDRRVLADQIERGRHVGQHAALRGNGELFAQLIEHREQRVGMHGTVGRRIDADDGVAGAKQKPVENTCGNAAGIVSRMIGLQPHR